METSEELYVTNRDEWRGWLKDNHRTRKEVWLIFYKKHTGKPSIAYDDAVEEALCFGWIDSIIKRIDDEKYTRKFTHRKANSVWSELNKRRAEKMVREGRMTQSGLAKIDDAKEIGEWSRRRTRRKRLKIPTWMNEALAANKKALDNFGNLAPSYRRQYIGWITSAKREETRKRRLEEAIRLLEKNERLGMK